MRGWHRLAKGVALAGLAAVLAAGCAAATGTAGTGATATGAIGTGATGTGATGTGATGTGATGTGEAAGSGSAGKSGKSGNSSNSGGNVAAFDARAKRVAAAWDKAGLAKEWRTGLVLTDPGELVFAGARNFATGDQKMAFVDGQFTLDGQLPTAPLTGRVRWPGGATASVRLLTAAQAYQSIATGQPCQGQPCPPKLVVTSATPGTLTVGTSRGEASVPAWTFTVRSLASPITVAGLAPGSYHTQPPSLPGVAASTLDGFNGAGLGPVSADGRQIHVLVGKSPCDTRSGALVYETSTAVVVGSWTYNPHPDGACPASLEVGSVPVELKQPLGDRVVLDVADGRPLTPGSF